MENITFRPLEEKDLPDRVRWFNQKEISQYLGPEIRNGTTLKKQKEWFLRFKKLGDREMFVIECNGTPIGNVALTDISKEDSNAGIFIVIGEKDFHGKGIGEKAVQYIVDLGFNKLHLHKIWLYVGEPNIAAQNLYLKFGFQEEGRLKEMWKIDGKYYDEIVMALFNPNEKE